VPSQLGWPDRVLGLHACSLIGRPAFLLAPEPRKCGANLMEDNRIDDCSWPLRHWTFEDR